MPTKTSRFADVLLSQLFQASEPILDPGICRGKTVPWWWLQFKEPSSQLGLAEMESCIHDVIPHHTFSLQRRQRANEACYIHKLLYSNTDTVPRPPRSTLRRNVIACHYLRGPRTKSHRAAWQGQERRAQGRKDNSNQREMQMNSLASFTLQPYSSVQGLVFMSVSPFSPSHRSLPLFHMSFLSLSSEYCAPKPIAMSLPTTTTPEDRLTRARASSSSHYPFESD